MYFAYGSNLHRPDWKLFCERHQFDPDNIRRIEPALLLDFRLQFGVYSENRRGGALNVLPATGNAVVGALFEVTDEGWQALDLKEGVPNVYRRQTVHVLDRKNQIRAVQTYVLANVAETEYYSPSEYYLRIVREGLEEIDLPTHTLLASAKNETELPFSDKLFCYGTLMARECRNHFLQQAKCLLVGEAQTNGELYDLGSYPGMTSSQDSTDAVFGELYQMSDVAGALQITDQVEGFNGFCSSSNEYLRALIKVTWNDQPVWAWTYLYTGRTVKRIASGNWRVR